MKQVYKVRTNRGWGWSVPAAPECPAFGSQAAAQRYCDLRNAGMGHLEAWDKVEVELPAPESKLARQVQEDGWNMHGMGPDGHGR